MSKVSAKPAKNDKSFDAVMSRVKGPTRVQAFRRGLNVDAPVAAASGAGWVADKMVDLVRPGVLPSFQEVMAGGTRAALDHPRYGPPLDEDSTPEAKRWNAAGQGLALGAVGAPFAAAAGPGAVAAELGLSMLGPYAGEGLRQKAEDAGMGPLSQAGASLGGELAATAGTPIGVAKGAPRVTSAAQSFARAWRASPEVQAIADNLGVPLRAMLDASGQAKTLIPEHASGDERYIQDAIDAIDEAIPRFTPDTMPTPEMILQASGEDAGYGISAFTQQAAKRPYVGARIAGRRRAATQALKDEYEALRPTVSGDGVVATYEAVRDMRWTDQAERWSRLHPDELPMIHTSRLKDAARESIAQAGSFPSDIPEEAAVILAMPNSIPWSEYQAIRSRMLKKQRISGKGTAETMEQMKTGNRRPIIDAFNHELDRLSAMATDATEGYRDALRSTRSFYNDFDPDSIPVRTLEDFTDTATIAKRLVHGSKRPVEDAERSMRIFSQSPEGTAGLQRMYWDDLVGRDVDNWTPGTAKKALGRLRERAESAQVVMGTEAYARLEDLLERLQVVSTTRAGTYGQAQATGSGMMNSPLDIMMAGPGAVKNPAGITSTAMTAVGNALKGRSQMFKNRVLLEAAMDPELFSTLLKLPTPREQEAWIINWQKLVGRASGRAVINAADEHIQPGVR